MYHWIETDPTLYGKVEHPDRVSGLVGVDEMLKHHNQNPQAREVGGWHLPSEIPGDPRKMTRWDRLVEACNHVSATDQAKSLGLK